MAPFTTTICPRCGFRLATATTFWVADIRIELVSCEGNHVYAKVHGLAALQTLLPGTVGETPSDEEKPRSWVDRDDSPKPTEP